MCRGVACCLFLFLVCLFVFTASGGVSTAVGGAKDKTAKQNKKNQTKTVT